MQIDYIDIASAYYITYTVELYIIHNILAIIQYICMALELIAFQLLIYTII